MRRKSYHEVILRYDNDMANSVIYPEVVKIYGFFSHMMKKSITILSLIANVHAYNS